MKKLLVLLLVAAGVISGIVCFFTRPAKDVSTASIATSGSGTENRTKENTTKSLSRTETVPVAAAPANLTQTPAADFSRPATPRPEPPLEERTLQMTRAIREALDPTNAADREMIYTNLLPALIALNPYAAGQVAETLAPGGERDDFLRRVAQDWPAVNANGAVTWAANLTNPDDRASTLTYAILHIPCEPMNFE